MYLLCALSRGGNAASLYCVHCTLDLEAARPADAAALQVAAANEPTKNCDRPPQQRAIHFLTNCTTKLSYLTSHPPTRRQPRHLAVTNRFRPSFLLFCFLPHSPTTQRWLFECPLGLPSTTSATPLDCKRRPRDIAGQHEGLPTPCSCSPGFPFPPWTLNRPDRRSIGPRTRACTTSSRRRHRSSLTAPPIAPQCRRRGSSARACPAPACCFRPSPAPRRRHRAA